MVTASLQWPTLSADALHGLPGRIVRAIEPHTEADPIAILSQTLVAFGNVVDRGPYFQVEADRHSLNLNAGVVGATSKGRKGTSWGQVRRLFDAVDPGWTRKRVQSNLSSGEGLIWAVRDPITKLAPVRKGGRVVDYQEVKEDAGVADKRLLVFETELASALRCIGREGNTLSATVRQAWDNGDLRILTKNSPAVATGAHVSIIGHITREELLRHLDRTEIANGFANRFIWIVVRRARCLPDGGHVPEDAVQELQSELLNAVTFGRSVGQILRDQDASDYWHVIYPSLSRGHLGLLGAVTSRAEAQVTRLACIYAVMDASVKVRRQHLEAALAIWQYAEESARYIFGEATGDPVADALVNALRVTPNGLSRTQIRDMFQKNRAAAEIDRSLGILKEAGVIWSSRSVTGVGRPTELWHLTDVASFSYDKNDLSRATGV